MWKPEIKRRARARSDAPIDPGDLVERHWEPAFRAAFLVAGDRLDAEDIAQEAMLKAARSLESYDGSRALEPWVNRIIANTARDWLRARGRIPRTVLAEVDQPDMGADPAEELADRCLPDELASALAALNPDFRIVIVLRHLLDIPNSEVGEILDVNAATVRSRLHRGLRDMRNQLEEGAEGHANEAG